MARTEQQRASKLATKDARKMPAKVQSDIDTSSDSDVSAAVEARKKKERELKHKGTAAKEETEALERQLADAEAKKKAKLEPLAGSCCPLQFVPGDVNPNCRIFRS